MDDRPNIHLRMINKLERLPGYLYRRYILYTKLKPLERQNARGLNFNSANTVALFSNPRGGSTWLGELLASVPKSALVYEPLYRGFIKTNGQMPAKHSGKTAEFDKLDFYYYQPIPEDENWPEAEEFFHQLFNRELITLSMYHENEWRAIPEAEKFIFKFCTADLLLPWLVKRFNIAPIFLTRHPCAVVASQLKHVGWQHVRSNPKVNFPDFRYNEVYKQYESIFKEISSPEENLAAFWAIRTRYVTQHSQNNKDWLTVSYEGLVSNPEEEVQRIFNYLNWEIPDTLWKQIHQPSSSSNASSLSNLQSGNQLSSWQRSLKPAQIDRILRIVEQFGITEYSQELEPEYKKLYSID